MVDEAGKALGFEPRILIDGPVDTTLDDGLAGDVVATLREALSNVARHAQAGRADVEVVVDDGTVCLRVTDDGVGPPTKKKQAFDSGRGLDNMSTRADRRGGTSELRAGADGGSILERQVPRP